MFKDGWLYEEGKDYEIKGAGDWKWCCQLKGNIFASPLQPLQSEDQEKQWHQVKEIFMDSYSKGEIPIQAIDKLREIFDITRKIKP